MIYQAYERGATPAEGAGLEHLTLNARDANAVAPGQGREGPPERSEAAERHDAEAIAATVRLLAHYGRIRLVDVVRGSGLPIRAVSEILGGAQPDPATADRLLQSLPAILFPAQGGTSRFLSTRAGSQPGSR